MTELATILNGFILIANIAVLGLSIKLYTEYFKDRSATARRKAP